MSEAQVEIMDGEGETEGEVCEQGQKEQQRELGRVVHGDASSDTDTASSGAHSRDPLSASDTTIFMTLDDFKDSPRDSKTVIDQLRLERLKNQKLAEQLSLEASLRKKAEERLAYLGNLQQKLHNETEREEEGLVNKLISKIVKIKKDKEKLAVDLEREEEGITNNLHRHMSQLRTEKRQMEDEVSELKRQLHYMQREKEQLARQVEEEEEKLSLSFLRRIREVTLEKSELESQLSKVMSLSSRSSRSSSFDQHSVTSSLNDSVMYSNASVISMSSVDDQP